MSFPDTRPTLLSRLRRHQDGAWDEFVRAYTGPALGFLSQQGLHGQDAEDVWQELLLRLSARSLATYRANAGRFRSWLMGGLRHRLGDWRKRAAADRRDMTKMVPGDAPVSPEDPAGPTLLNQMLDHARRHYAETRPAVEETLEHLLRDYPDEREKRAYLDWFWNDDDLTDAEIAARQGYNRYQLIYLRKKVAAHLRRRWDEHA